MKKILALILAGILILSLAACFGKNADSKEPSGNDGNTASDSVSEADKENDAESDPELGLVVKGKDNTLAEPFVIYDKDGVKISFAGSEMYIDGDEFFSLVVWKPEFVLENNSDAAQLVSIELAEDYGEGSGYSYFFGSGRPRIELAAGQKLEFNDGVSKELLVDGKQRFGKKYADFEKVPMTIRINDDIEVKATVFPLTVGGPYEDEAEVDYTGKFDLKISGEPYIRQTAKNPDYFTYCVDITFTNNSDMVVYVGYGQAVAPGESVTVQSNIAEESQNSSALNPHQTYSVSVNKENGAPLTVVSIEY